MIEVNNLSYAYKKNPAIQFPDFVVAQGEHCLLIGESGCGKTTLLHILGGLLRGYSGKIKYSDTELSTLSESALDGFRGKNIGFIFQKNHLISALTVEKNITIASYLSGIKADAKRVDFILNRLGITEKATSNVTAISQGQAQRVAIARAVLNAPSVILADEPTSALDDKSCERVINLLIEVANENKSSLLIATHDQRLKNKINKQLHLTSDF
jgi:ABC-type lipoprotein export system ATPase subunit